MRGGLFGLYLGVGLAAWSTGADAADPILDRIHSQLMVIRAQRSTHPLHVFNYGGDNAKDRGAAPVLMNVKHELRDWVETRLRQFRPDDDPANFAKALNARLDAADLTCASPKESTRCTTSESEFDGTGYLDGISIEMQDYWVESASNNTNHESDAHAIFIVKTDLGILCGNDESAYVYEWGTHRLERILEDEQVIDMRRPYTPQHIDAVHIGSISEKATARNVLVLGHQEWCSSTWYDTYHRIWRTTSDGKPPLLVLSDATYSWMDNDPPIEGSINSKEALVEFRVNSLDSGVHSYETVRHYALDGSRPLRIAPIALGPRAFTEEWLKADWNEGRDWSNSSQLTALQNWHKKLHADFLLGEFGDTTHCSAKPELWRVEIEFTKDDASINEKQKYAGVVYFTLRWRPPYQFQMMAIATAPDASCSEVDQDADSDRTLFPVQDWVGWK